MSQYGQSSMQQFEGLRIGLGMGYFGLLGSAPLRGGGFQREPNQRGQSVSESPGERFAKELDWQRGEKVTHPSYTTL